MNEAVKPRGLLIDLDGTMYQGRRMIAGADTFIRMLKRRKLRYLFVTNNSSAAPETVAERLKAMGIPADPAEICTSAQAAAFYIAERRPAANVYVIGEDGLRKALADAGLRLLDDGPDALRPGVVPTAAAVMPDLVVQGIDRQLTYGKLAAAVRYIRGGAGYVLTNPDVLLPSDGELMPGAGTIAAMLKTATGIEPELIGKPSPILMNFALRRLGLDAGSTWVVGDNPATDIAAGNAAGYHSALVLTGLATPGNYAGLLEAAGCKADAVFDNLHTLRSHIEEKLEV